MKQTMQSLFTIAVVVAIGCGLALAAGEALRTLWGMPLLLALALLAFAVQWVVFVPSFLAQTEHYYDLTGSATYLLVIGLAFGLGHGVDGDPRATLLAVLCAVWALRLGSFLFRRVRKAGKDGRFDAIKPDPARFLVAWTLQGLWVFLTLFAALIAMVAAPPVPLDGLALVGTLVWLAGFGIEAVADAQKSAFSADPANRGRFIQTGLWRWSRHPNYFGEIVLWVGIALIATPTLAGWQYLGWLSPVFVAFLLTRVSGVPLLEQRADAKWGGQPDYEAYKAATPVLIPRPPRS